MGARMTSLSERSRTSTTERLDDCTYTRALHRSPRASCSVPPGLEARHHPQWFAQLSCAGRAQGVIGRFVGKEPSRP